jgi:hypothetical protein
VNEFAPLSGLVGGLMLGAAASALVLLAGRVAGISGIVAGGFRARGIELGWRAAFVLGLVLGPLAVALVKGAPVVVRVPASAAGLVLAGLLVGFGARLGGGCTSGHGVCGISRLSPRSLVATGVFIAAGIAVVFAVRHVLGLPTWP